MASNALNLFDEAIELVAARFRLLGDASRLRLLRALMEGDHSVQELVEECGLSQTNVSRHLGLMRRDGVVAVTDGLAAGETVLVRGLQRVRDGSAVKIVGGAKTGDGS